MVNLNVLKKRAFNFRWAEVDDDVIPLTAADPDFPVAKEIGASIETIDTMESGDPEESYLTAMRANLEKIYQSLL